MKSAFQTLLLSAGAIWICVAGFAGTLDDTGVIALRAITTNVDGSGIRVAQAEASAPPFEVDPAAVGQPGSLFSYFSSAGGVTNDFPNNVGVKSDHADGVGNFFYGMPSGVATNVAHVDNFDADYFVNTYVISNLATLNDAVVNQSFTFSEQSVSVQRAYDAYYDNYSVQNKTLFVSAANNYGNYDPANYIYTTTNVVLPGTAYNCISVGAYINGNYYNSIGPTIDNGRCKPDISGEWSDTSTATAQISGAAALLMQAALRGDGGSDTNSASDIRTIKALLLNGAVKPLGWTNGNSAPLDARYGAGVVNVLNSYEQLAGGKHVCIATSTVPLNAAHPPTGVVGTVSALSGWNFATNTSGISSDSIHHFYFNVSNAVGSVKFDATATLVWNRHINYSDVNDLDLLLYNTADSNLIAASTSYVNNVEHLYVTNLAQGRYDLQVWKAGGTPGVNIVSAAEPYALAWEFVPPPAVTISGTTNPVLSWPVYPAGFCVEARTNLQADTWSTNDVPPLMFTNGQNSIPLNTPNAAQFFRLRKPSF